MPRKPYTNRSDYQHSYYLENIKSSEVKMQIKRERELARYYAKREAKGLIVRPYKKKDLEVQIDERVPPKPIEPIKVTPDEPEEPDEFSDFSILD